MNAFEHMRSKGPDGELEPDYKRVRSSATGTEVAYSVEARHSEIQEPIQLNDQIFDGLWREVKFKASPIGVPSDRYYARSLEHGLLGYEAAQALRWWLHAESRNAIGGGYCLETRIIAHKITYSHKVEAVGVADG